MTGWRRSAACSSSSCVEVQFATSTFSGGDGCVAVGVDGERWLVRDSKDPAGPVLTFTPTEWAAFVAGVKAGEFDPPAG